MHNVILMPSKESSMSDRGLTNSAKTTRKDFIIIWIKAPSMTPELKGLSSENFGKRSK